MIGYSLVFSFECQQENRHKTFLFTVENFGTSHCEGDDAACSPYLLAFRGGKVCGGEEAFPFLGRAGFLKNIGELAFRVLPVRHEKSLQAP